MGNRPSYQPDELTTALDFVAEKLAGDPRLSITRACTLVSQELGGRPSAPYLQACWKKRQNPEPTTEEGKVSRRMFPQEIVDKTVEYVKGRLDKGDTMWAAASLAAKRIYGDDAKPSVQSIVNWCNAAGLGTAQRNSVHAAAKALLDSGKSHEQVISIIASMPKMPEAEKVRQWVLADFPPPPLAGVPTFSNSATAHVEPPARVKTASAPEAEPPAPSTEVAVPTSEPPQRVDVAAVVAAAPPDFDRRMADCEKQLDALTAENQELRADLARVAGEAESYLRELNILRNTAGYYIADRLRS